MEDWAFRYLEPDTYKTIAAQLDEKRADREAYISGIIERLQAELALHCIEAEVSGRPKHIASIVNKMRRKRLSFEQLYDIRAVRVLVRHEIDCYTVLDWCTTCGSRFRANSTITSRSLKATTTARCTPR